jgi:signal transduction histidine kinase
MKTPDTKTCQQQLAALQKEFDEFTYLVSHDLKAPLRAICNLSGWIKEDLGEQMDSDIQHNLDLLQNRALRMERKITGLLAFSKLTTYGLDVRETNVLTLVQDITDALQKKYSLEVHASGLPTFSTYAAKLELVFFHLLQNAVTFHEQEKPQVWIGAMEEKDRFLFKVRDNGIGIPEDAQEKIFKMFYTLQPKDKLESLGMGLTIVKKIIQFMGGSIQVHSVVGQGTTFTFSWSKTL